MEKKIASAGNFGDKIRSDCRVTLGLRNEGGLNFEIKSKVKVLYGKSIQEQLLKMCNFFELQHADVTIEDSGAIPAVIAARFEAALDRKSVV